MAAAREPDEVVDDREALAEAAALRRVVLRRQPNIERANVRVAQRIVGEHLRRVLERDDAPGQPRRTFQRHGALDALAQREAVDLVRARLRQRVHEVNLDRSFVLDHLGLAVLEELFFGQRYAGIEDDERDEHLAQARIPLADGRGLADLRVLEQHLVDLARVHVEAADDDHVLLAVDEEDETLFVDVADVARVHPAVAIRARRLLGLIAITRTHLRAAHAQLAALTKRQHAIATLEIHDLQLGARHGIAHGEQLALAAAVHVEAKRRALGHAPTLEDRLTRLLE